MRSIRLPLAATLLAGVLLSLSAQGASTPALKLDGYYKLKTVFQGAGKCLEGNQAASTVHDGAAFMDTCQNVSGQLFQFVPEGDYYRIKTMFQGEGKCLEGNQAGSPVHNGAAFMDTCQNVTGQLWQIIPDGANYRLKTQFRGAGECLEGNQSGSPVHNGDAFMDTCQSVTGQLWQITEPQRGADGRPMQAQPSTLGTRGTSGK